MVSTVVARAGSQDGPDKKSLHMLHGNMNASEIDSRFEAIMAKNFGPALVAA